MTSLAEIAAAKARPESNGTAVADEQPLQGEPLPDTELPDIDIPVPEGGPEQVPVHVAWSRVMGTVRSVGKERRVTEGPARFAYRGVDEALNVFGPACRAHGVLVLPYRVESAYRDTTTSTGKPTRECTVLVTYRIYGPMGDHLEVQAAGESLDTQDKGSAKAQAVALRTLLYHAGLVPTRDPDPDSQQIDRGEAPVRPAVLYVEEICNPRTTVGRLRQIRFELGQSRQLGAIVTNETGDEEPVGTLIDRIGKERATGGAS
jgi:hypothetical protein